MSETASKQRAALHRLVDELPDPDVRTAARVLEALRATAADPVLRALMDAPEEDEAISEEEEASVAEALAEADRGEPIPHEEVKRRWGLG